jgi:hypothetical protein
MSYPYARQNPYRGAYVFFVSKSKFIDMAVAHGMACNLEADDQRTRAAEGGSAVLKQWEKTYRSDYTEMTIVINAALWSAFWIIVIVVALAIGVAANLDRLGLSLPLDPVRAVTFIGSALVAWATLMELAGDFPVWDDKAFPQLAHTVIFKIIFLSGILLVLTSVLI